MTRSVLLWSLLGRLVAGTVVCVLGAMAGSYLGGRGASVQLGRNVPFQVTFEQAAYWLLIGLGVGLTWMVRFHAKAKRAGHFAGYSTVVVAVFCLAAWIGAATLAVALGLGDGIAADGAPNQPYVTGSGGDIS